jgi:hypothetical protein
MANNFPNLDWFNTEIMALPKHNWLYKISCFILCKKYLTYKEMYLILQRINNHLDNEESKKRAMSEIINIYNFNNK